MLGFKLWFFWCLEAPFFLSLVSWGVGGDRPWCLCTWFFGGMTFFKHAFHWARSPTYENWNTYPVPARSSPPFPPRGSTPPLFLSPRPPSCLLFPSSPSSPPLSVLLVGPPALALSSTPPPRNSVGLGVSVILYPSSFGFDGSSSFCAPLVGFFCETLLGFLDILATEFWFPLGGGCPRGFFPPTH